MKKMIIGIMLALLFGISFALPDYILNVTPTAISPTTVTFNVTTRNVGTTNAINWSVTNATGTMMGYPVPPLAVGQGITFQTTVSCSGGVAYFHGMADSTFNITESNEFNNGLYMPVQCGQQLPNLVIDPFSITNYTSNGTLYYRITMTTRNNGAGNAGASVTGTSVPGGSTVYYNIPMLAPGATSSVTRDVACQQSWVNFRATADNYSQVAESNEYDNSRGINLNQCPPVCRTQGQTCGGAQVCCTGLTCSSGICVNQSQPDLVADASNLSGNKIVGQPFSVPVSTRNIGNAVAGVSITRVTFGSGQNLNVPSLAAGGMNTQTASVVCPFVGSIPFSSTADYYNNVAESNEANNGWSTNVNCVAACIPQGGACQYNWNCCQSPQPLACISGVCSVNQSNNTQPDLIITTLTVPTSMIQGRSYSGTVVTRNNGEAASVASVTRIVYGGRTIANIAIPALTVGGQLSRTFSISCNGYESNSAVIATADSTNTNVESSETNNARSATSRCIVRANVTNATIDSVPGGGKTTSPAVSILNALGITFSDELLNAICAGR
jgi:subtilase family serine protease